jgi:hypothetical protein
MQRLQPRRCKLHPLLDHGVVQLGLSSRLPEDLAAAHQNNTHGLIFFFFAHGLTSLISQPLCPRECT